MQRALERAVIDRERVPVALSDARPDCQHEGVIGQGPAVGRVRALAGAVDPPKRAQEQLGTAIADDLAQRIAASSRVGERFADGHRGR